MKIESLIDAWKDPEISGFNGDKEEARRLKLGAAWNASYADALDFASAGNKKPLKAWEIFFVQGCDDGTCLNTRRV